MHSEAKIHRNVKKKENTEKIEKNPFTNKYINKSNEKQIQK